MPNSPQPSELQAQIVRQRPQRRRGLRVKAGPGANKTAAGNIDVGHCLRELRTEHSLSLRALAEQSGLNVNTLSMIENGKTSPSVSTLQQLALTLAVPITAFFETALPKTSVVYQNCGKHPQVAFSYGTLEDLGAGITGHGAEPFVVELEPGADSGLPPIVHMGREFVYCLEGCLVYIIEEQTYNLEPGDSLLFEAHLPHRWQNSGLIPSRSLLVLCPGEENDHLTKHHFTTE
jgi:transcriptional regulator with XRE-family HTH domain